MMSDKSRLPYSTEEFAARHGLSHAVADIVLRGNRSSKDQADRGAEDFKQAAQSRLDKPSRKPS